MKGRGGSHQQSHDIDRFRAGKVAFPIVLRILQSWVNLIAVLTLSLLSGLAFYRAVEAAIEQFPSIYEHPLRWSNHGNAMWITDELARRDRSAILFAGSSTTRTAFDEMIFHEELGDHFYIENLSNSTTDPAGIYHYLRYLEKHRPEALPDILIQGVEELELQNEHDYHAFHSHLTQFFSDRELFDADPIFREEMSRPERRRTVWIETSFPLYARRSALRNSAVGAFVWPLWTTRVPWGEKRQIMDRRWLSRFRLRPYDWNYMRVASRSDEARRVRGLDNLARNGQFDPARYTFPNTQTKSLRAIAEFCAERGILHYAVVMPGVPEKFESYFTPEITHALAQSITTAYDGTPTRVVDLWHFLPGEDFFDSLHINEHGRGPISRLTARLLLADAARTGDDWPPRRGKTAHTTDPVLAHREFPREERERFVVPGDEKWRRTR